MILGIDLTSSPRRRCAYSLLDGSGALVTLGYLGDNDEIVSKAGEYQVSIVTIDASLGFPKGQCCLEESCTCRSVWPEKGRLCERELAKRGSGSFFTTKRSIIKDMVYRGVALDREMTSLGYQVLEVYPYASKVCLFGRPIPSKMTPQGLTFLRDHLSQIVGGLEPHTDRLDHDLCDALIAAYTGYLHTLGQTETLGLPEEGMIVLPRLPC